jgi:hypothetical protein
MMFIETSITSSLSTEVQEHLPIILASRSLSECTETSTTKFLSIAIEEASSHYVVVRPSLARACIESSCRTPLSSSGLYKK